MAQCTIAGSDIQGILYRSLDLDKAFDVTKGKFVFVYIVMYTVQKKTNSCLLLNKGQWAL